MIRVFVVLLAMAMIVASGVVVYGTMGDLPGAVQGAVSQLDGAVSDDPTPRTFEVRAGQTASEIGQALEQEGLIRSASYFRLLVRLRGAEDRFDRGEFELRATMTTSQVIDALLLGGDRGAFTFTIPEGWRAEQIALHLGTLGHVDQAEFMRVLADPPRVAPYDSLLGHPPSLEGYVFPDTYEIAPGASAEDVVELMVRQFVERVGPDFRRNAESVGLTTHEAVTLASIIEREAVVPEERALISGVFHNRLRDGMRLEADATVQYALVLGDASELGPGGFWPEVVPSDLHVESPFNTYRVQGLPPGPICNPGVASLQAAVQPVATDYYYFVAAADGSHLFATTLDEHLENIRRVMQSPPLADPG